MLHYEMTYEEVRATGRFTDRGDHNRRPNPICRNGSFHAVTTRDKGAVTCPACRAALPAAPAFVDVGQVTEYGLTQPLSRAVRVF